MTGTSINPVTKLLVDVGWASFPGEWCGTEKTVISGEPDMDPVSTSYIEKQNLTMRMRRFIQLKNGFSKKLEYLCHAVSLYFMHYNFARKHMTLKKTPAIQAGIADPIWTLDEIVGLADLNSN